MTPRTVTIQDVARRAGVSAQTVSNVLNRPERVTPATARKVRTAVDALGYRAHAAARRLRTRRSDTIALRLDPLPGGISGTIMDVFLHEVTVRAAALGLQVLLYACEGGQAEIDRLRELIASGDVDGVILTGTHVGDPRPAWLAEQDVPCVSFGRPWGEEDTAPHAWVDVDGTAGTRAATQHLIEGGSRRIGFVGWPGDGNQGAARREGWRTTLLDHALATSRDVDRLTVTSPDTVEDALRAASDLQSRHPDLDGIVCASDSLAFGAFLAVGSGVPVIGFDNTPVARAVGLSSVDQRIDLVARTVLDLLLDDDGHVVSRERESRIITPELRPRRAVVQDPERAGA
ncbi:MULTISPECIES: LacI family DNA-binding transcriptional regulator [unclassified Actinomyces]|uniref:LacI family DNA-binding transcriptional regulator n=1 Tax=unclassified Actinomyces TaxID=2609248 RepID=UPI002016F039|nr:MULTISPECIES: LacI family DNA-binding transcriptional regulator [unclassified Actinomyces]MCL3777344.1 LacI family DNA-binding transcriptional regulator [Actinomyces sp. AC-20-1]MCL3790478.1 LacI family DNA-binding transcriptional regulator [Actinomyces sp. 187325]MCL3792746.1 LacI family DNA-binding transcriptional regulator [Actinomyces sp. 186855]MCL3794950.1 LacI family DNA-binding transcriptional regulator [Actinomyces sp. 217892]